MQELKKEKKSEQILQKYPEGNFEVVSEEQNDAGKSEITEAAREISSVAKPVCGYTKVQLISSERFSGKRDILSALLSENQEYSVYDAENIIEKFMKGKVK